MAIKHIFPHAVIAVVFVPGLKIFVVIMIPNRTFLNFFRFFIIAYIISDVVQFIILIFTAYISIIFYVIVLLIRICINLVFCAYSEQLIDELDNASNNRELEENNKRELEESNKNELEGN
ncbi:hypothetical protein H8356DRAFT_1271286 [Neocallimastix lanati (nom. inval.)]|uniref:Uncharacterized protein n=1 Tax=Neocallimastix californiae TaxID=1754190 RepID=A0A1Y2CQM9_9FUNG|nr:hypothetical protein H8356DRAFT_1271286 [Neocallimastix sp. JGI-2020a]ORY49273.1 hypothetical protein LY90DRAFT_508756 [Neocallimastix californiae]|eukprot:ORY49273.1 hypothetical protein LY90DRAFT_508756 [Neocallimastix californiae]